MRPKGPLDSPDEIGGIALEGLVLQHLKAWCDYSTASAKIYFWKSRGGSEVDFVLYGENFFYAIEVKNAKTVHPGDLRSLKTFMDDYPEATPLLLYRGGEKRMIDRILCHPVEDFLKQLTPNTWPDT